MKAWVMSKATAQVAQSLLKIETILSDTTLSRPAVNWEDWNHTENQKEKPHFLRWITRLLFISFSKSLRITERRLTGLLFLDIDFSPTFLNTGTTDETFQYSGKQDSSRHLLKSTVRIYEISGSHFFTTTTGIQSGLDTFGKPKMTITFQD